MAKFGNIIVFSSVYLWLAEVYPTTLRVAGYVVVCILGAVGRFIAPIVYGLVDYWIDYP